MSDEPTYVANPEAETLNQPTTNDQTDPYSTNYNNPPVSNLQVSVDQRGTPIPLSTIDMPQPAALTTDELNNYTSVLFNAITNSSSNANTFSNEWYQGVSIILHCGPESYAIGRINLPYPSYITYAQLVELGQNLMSKIQSNPTEFLQHIGSQEKNTTLLTQLLLSQVVGITLNAYKFNWMNPNTKAPVYT